MPDPTDPTEELLKKLSSLLGGRPQVHYSPPPAGPRALGQWVDRESPNHPTRYAYDSDLMYLHPDLMMNSPMAPLVVSHEMGHRLFAQMEPDSMRDDPRPRGITGDSEMQGFIQQLYQHPRENRANPTHDPERVINKDASEAFAQSFGGAVNQLDSSPLQMPSPTSPYQTPEPRDVQFMKAWLLKHPEFANRRGVPFSTQLPDATRSVIAKRK